MFDCCLWLLVLVQRSSCTRHSSPVHPVTRAPLPISISFSLTVTGPFAKTVCCLHLVHPAYGFHVSGRCLSQVAVTSHDKPCLAASILGSLVACLFRRTVGGRRDAQQGAVRFSASATAWKRLRHAWDRSSEWLDDICDFRVAPGNGPMMRAWRTRRVATIRLVSWSSR
jgi:hypothetical protein